MFRARAFVAANASHLLIGGALIIGMVTIPLMANTLLGESPLGGGLMLLRMTVAIPFGAVLGGVVCQRYDYRLPTALGLLLAALGFWLMSGWGLDIADPWLTVHLATAGFGFGLLIAPIALAATNSVSDDARGAAAALITTSRVVGMTLGVAALTAWGTGRFDALVVGAKSPVRPAGRDGRAGAGTNRRGAAATYGRGTYAVQRLLRGSGSAVFSGAAARSVHGLEGENSRR